jgi:predicted Zn-dependent protease
VPVEAARAQFKGLAESLSATCRSGEVLLLSYYGEDSDFARINQSRMRQVGHVSQREVHLTLIRGQRNAEVSCTLGGDPAEDQARLNTQLGDLRALLDTVADDPYLQYSSASTIENVSDPFKIPNAAEAVGTLLDLAADVDLVGLWASGTQVYGFANNFGQRHWYATGSFNLDASVHLPNGRAVKLCHAGQTWDQDRLAAKLSQAQRWAGLLQHTPRSLRAGGYRAYLTPRALADLLQVVTYGGFGRRAVETRGSPLVGMYLGDRRLNSQVSISEARGSGFLPSFSDAGFTLPESVRLIVAGRGVDLLTDRRSALEYGAVLNTDIEAARSLSVAGGRIPVDTVLQSLGTGLYINNLWYTNLSELQNCRITGSTRFACFWVEEGQFVAPLATSRFDDSLYEVLGDRLLGLTSEIECLLDSGTYGSRSGASLRLPGVLLENLRFVM